MDIGIIQETAPLYWQALQVTLRLAVVGILLSLVLGFGFGLIRYFKLPVIAPVIGAYIELARNTPLLIQLYFLYYGLPKVGLPLEKNSAAIIGLTFLGAAYMAEAFRSSFDTVPLVQVESGRSLGFSHWQLARVVIFPQALPQSIPSLGANCIFLLKETSVFSAISIMDLTNTAKDLIGMYYMTREFLLMLVVSYGLVILPMILLIHFLEWRVRRVNYGV